MFYFEQFKSAIYNIDGGTEWTLVTDIFKRVRLRTNVKDNVTLLDPFDVPDGESPEMIAERHHGSPEYYWVILVVNNITDPYHDWPKSERQMQLYLADKYGDAAQQNAPHHYEIYQTSGDDTETIEVDNVNYPSATAVSNYTYEHKVNETKRSISLLRNAYLGQFTQEFSELVS